MCVAKYMLLSTVFIIISVSLRLTNENYIIKFLKNSSVCRIPLEVVHA